MANQSEQDVLNEILASLKNAGLLKKINKIFLFGSRARGDADPRSDIDLSFDAPKLTKKEWLDVIDILENADTLLKIDASRFDESSDTLQTKIITEGKIIHE